MMKKIMMCMSGVMLMLCISMISMAGEVSLDDARVVAQNWLTHSMQAYGSWAGSSSPQIIGEETMMSAERIVGYNFLIAPKGHIVVPFRDELPVVKLYSDTTTLSMSQETDITQWVKQIELLKIYDALDAHAGEMAAIDFSTTPNGRLWDWFKQQPAVFSRSAETTREKTEALSIGPLLSTAWSQGDPYNLQTPLWYTGERTVTGCVATAAAQIMKYWNHPATGQSSTSYTWYNGSTNVTLSRNFSTSTYDWANMTNTYGSGSTTTQKNAVAKLMGDVGIAFHMNYGRSADGGSGANTGYGTTVYPTYFKYKSSIQYVYRSSYASDSAWMKVFKNEVQAGRPSQFRAADDSGAGGHSFVVDGYRDSPAEQIHVNLGWSGSYNGWYVSNNIATGNYDWNTGQAALIGIEPITTPTTYSYLLWTKGSTSSSGFNSQFNGDAAGWQAYSGSWSIASSAYLYTPGQTNLWSTVGYNATFSNFDYQARLYRYGSDGNANGLFIRGNPTLCSDQEWTSNYQFLYSRNGGYSVWKQSGCSATALQSWTYSSSINQGNAWNTLRVYANGSSLYFYINGTLVWAGSDAAFSSGRVGIGMYSDGASGNALYVDWATLNVLASAAEANSNAQHPTISAEQQALNEAANASPAGSPENSLNIGKK